mgnify:CR=1 FL=1
MPNHVSHAQGVPQNLRVCIEEAQRALRLIERVEHAQTGARIAWLEGQLEHLVAQLKIVLIDIEAGETSGPSASWAETDAQEMVEDSLTVIANLKSLIQSLRAQGR